MGYLSNRTVNCLNIHAALYWLVEQPWWVFVPIFLYQQGFSLAEIFLLYGLFNTARIPMRLLAFPIVHRIGLKYALMLGVAGVCCSLPLLAQVKGWDGWLAAYIIVFGLFNALQWHCFHTFYSLSGESEHRAKHISVYISLSLVTSAFAPLLSAIFIAHSGFQYFFLLALPMMILLLCVLSRAQNIPVSRTRWRDGKKLLLNIGTKIHLAEATAQFPLNIGWLLVLYFYVEKIVSLGLIVTFGIAFQIIYQLWIGSVVDRGSGTRVAHAAGLFKTLQVLGKALLPLSLPRIIALEAVTAATNVHHAIAQPTVMYNAAKSSADAFWYWFFAETAYDISTLIGAGAVALLLFWGVPLQLTILVSLPGTLIVWWLTWRYFKTGK